MSFVASIAFKAFLQMLLRTTAAYPTQSQN